VISLSDCVKQVPELVFFELWVWCRIRDYSYSRAYEDMSGAPFSWSGLRGVVARQVAERVVVHLRRSDEYPGTDAFWSAVHGAQELVSEKYRADDEW
jgi:hypothetical protein